jgi:membrane-associated phospholipid phosphatase
VRARRWGPQLRFALGQLGLVLAAVAVYFVVRSLTEGAAAEAERNAGWLVDLERGLGMFVERDLQQFALDIDGVLPLVNAIYIYGHWPVIALALGWLAWRRRDAYLVYRNALLISGVVGMVVVALFPVAPPRLMDLGFLDTVTLHTDAYRVLQPPAFTNQYAAMPSFHVGWDLLVGIALAREGRRLWLQIVGYALPLLMLVSVVLTGNHYLVDAVVGDVIVLSALAVARHRTMRSAHAARDAGVAQAAEPGAADDQGGKHAWGSDLQPAPPSAATQPPLNDAFRGHRRSGGDAASSAVDNGLHGGGRGPRAGAAVGRARRHSTRRESFHQSME